MPNIQIRSKLKIGSSISHNFASINFWAWNAISEVIKKRFLGSMPPYLNRWWCYSGQPNDNKDCWRSWEKSNGYTNHQHSRETCILYGSSLAADKRWNHPRNTAIFNLYTAHLLWDKWIDCLFFFWLSLWLLACKFLDKLKIQEEKCSTADNSTAFVYSSLELQLGINRAFLRSSRALFLKRCCPVVEMVSTNRHHF